MGDEGFGVVGELYRVMREGGGDVGETVGVGGWSCSRRFSNKAELVARALYSWVRSCAAVSLWMDHACYEVSMRHRLDKR